MIKKVTLELIKDDDGHWLCFKDPRNREAMISIENIFSKKTLIDSVIRDWAAEQFKIKKTAIEGRGEGFGESLKFEVQTVIEGRGEGL